MVVWITEIVKRGGGFRPRGYYLFITYIVTSKPKRISIAAGFVHMVDLLVKLRKLRMTNTVTFYLVAE